jgi:hypothetical protein
VFKAALRRSNRSICAVLLKIARKAALAQSNLIAYEHEHKDEHKWGRRILTPESSSFEFRFGLPGANDAMYQPSD